MGAFTATLLEEQLATVGRMATVGRNVGCCCGHHSTSQQTNDSSNARGLEPSRAHSALVREVDTGTSGHRIAVPLFEWVVGDLSKNHAVTAPTSMARAVTTSYTTLLDSTTSEGHSRLTMLHPDTRPVDPGSAIPNRITRTSYTTQWDRPFIGRRQHLSDVTATTRHEAPGVPRW